jgi:hypothetical protein
MMIMMVVEATVMIKCSKLRKEGENQKAQDKCIIDRSILF